MRHAEKSKATVHPSPPASEKTCVLVVWLLSAFPVSAADYSAIKPTVEAAIARKELPGCVVAVLHKGKIVYREAFGQRALQPAPEPMTVDTIFDLASLTKPIATATSMMILLDQGKLQLRDKAATYWPDFGANGKDAITLEQLLLHSSGLIADNPLADYKDGRETALERIAALKPVAPAGQKFTYSDVNFIALGEIVRRVSGQPLDEFARQHIFEPLKMTDTAFKPSDAARARCAPTQQRDGFWMRGEVHDPRAFALGCVAGHAGLFGTADDLLNYARCLLRGGKPLLQSSTVEAFTRPREVPTGLRTVGWDVQTSFSSNKGAFPRDKGFGHTGFTGTSLWIDPASETALVFLSNRVHPDGKGNVTKLRGDIATIVARAVGYKAPEPVSPPVESSRPALSAKKETLTGIDVLVREKFARLQGRKIGLVTNHTGRDRDGRATIDLLHQAPGVTLVALFSPEHGIRGALDDKVGDGKDEKTGLPVFSLYGPRRKPSAETLAGIDTLVFDIQDVGCRFYTYSTTLKLVMEAAADHKLRMIVLDRPNPIGGMAVEGPLLEAGRESFIAAHSLPVRHGMTFGELARMYNEERKIGADLDVVKIEGWSRGQLYDETLLPWINPSPNMRNLTEALLYPGIGLLETTNVSVGRGTDTPFEWIGAPWIDGRRLAAALAAKQLPGVRFVPTSRTPTSSVHATNSCGGVQIFLTDWSKVDPLRLGLTIACELRRLYPEQWNIDRFDALLLHRPTWEGVKAGRSADELIAAWQPDLAAFRARRGKFLLYD
jgi:uncharacterized protein YbbC (DUF1343 family)/CubicO group peptidase (beta-lactamase class C family)